jgi:hypothetical protein
MVIQPSYTYMRLAGDARDMESTIASNPHETMCGLPVQLCAGLAYCASSAGMVLLNKFALSAFGFNSITSLLIFQCLFCVVAVRTTAALGLITLEVISTPEFRIAAAAFS